VALSYLAKFEILMFNTFPRVASNAKAASAETSNFTVIQESSREKLSRLSKSVEESLAVTARVLMG
jgi:hypothetical protein